MEREIKTAPPAGTICDVILAALRERPGAASSDLRLALSRAGKRPASLDGQLDRLRRAGRIKRTGARMHYRYSVAK